MLSHVFISYFIGRTKSICDVSRTLPIEVHRSLNCLQTYERGEGGYLRTFSKFPKLKSAL
jgi:hypothetical protein